jgi:hypothetical protein
MKKGIIKISLWSWKSLISLYGKIATLIFAIICVTFGLTVKTASAGVSSVDTKAVKGKTLFASDSSLLKNVKLYLCSVVQPVYGMSGPYYTKIDSTTSDTNGNFEMKCDSAMSAFAVMTADKVIHGTSNNFFVSSVVYFPLEKDTLFTLYLSPYISTSVKNQQKVSPVDQLHINQGGNVSIKIPEFLDVKMSASVVNIAGETITDLYPSADGTIKWNTETVAKGIYFVNINNSTNSINMKITVR